MHFQLSEEQQLLQDSLRRYVTKEYGFDKRRTVIASERGFSEPDWRAFAEMGLLGFTFPEAYGGLGGSAFDTMLVTEAFGRGLVVEPYLSSVVLGGGLIRDAGSEAQKDALLPAIAEGELLLGFAHYETPGRYALSYCDTRAVREGDEFILNGRKSVVLHGAQANKLIVSARSSGGVEAPEGLSLFLIDTDAAGVRVRGYATHDGQRAAEVYLSDARIGADALIGRYEAALPAIEQAIDLAIAALCAEAVGAMDALNAATLEYLKTRKQFGVPIGSFQVLRHRMADMFIAAEQTRSMAILAAAKASAAREERRRALSMAKALVGQSARLVGQQAVQLHGGMGVTDEMAASHYFKRLTMINVMFGDSDHHLAQVSDALLAKRTGAQA
jgi:alkylation response protein AidB-like acyl-CoA dehydrogenase